MSKIIAVDFDGTLCIGDNWPSIGYPNWPLIHYLKEEKCNGSKIILWTCRTGKELSEAVEWCSDKGLIFDTVNDNLPEIIDAFGDNCRKVVADEYIDDKAKFPDVGVKNCGYFGLRS